MRQLNANFTFFMKVLLHISIFGVRVEIRVGYDSTQTLITGCINTQTWFIPRGLIQKHTLLSVWPRVELLNVLSALILVYSWIFAGVLLEIEFEWCFSFLIIPQLIITRLSHFKVNKTVYTIRLSDYASTTGYTSNRIKVRYEFSLLSFQLEP